MNTKLLFTFLLVLVVSQVPNSWGQGRKDLEERRREILEDIKQNNRLLSSTKKDKAAALDRVMNLQTQIQSREELLQTLKSEIEHLSISIERSGEVTEALGDDIEQLKKEYAQMIRKAYRIRMNHNPALLILSAHGPGQAFKRWQYLKQYDRYRKRQAKLIVETQKTLENKISSLEARKADKQTLLSSIEEQKGHLNKEKKEKEVLVKDLKKDEKRIQSTISQRQKQHEQLNKSIENVIVAEMDARRREARRLRANTNKKPKTTENAPATNNAEDEEESPASAAASGSFQRNKGKLPWPVSGYITRRFGKQKHPTLPKVEIVSNGIDIRSESGNAAKVVFEGNVVGVSFVPGFNNTVIVQHGNYYTVYSNLSEVSVRKGDIVGSNQGIGTIATTPEGNLDLHFEVWQGKQRLNPTSWLRRG